ncbi:MAG: DUF3105 domain-containing protein [Candidatus Eremiobacteraeota bacterium]|nr:DUF3105 domain-containing protein [Candidatus Eremiobacteraeota bacterium]MBV8366333.1 DUF3105 domain-containing protein [Candidatus Eremiobacteraeota bacterium]
MSKRIQQAPADQTGRIVTIALGVLVIVGLITLVALSFTHQSGQTAANATATPSPSPTPTSLPRPRATPGIHYKSQGHAGHDKKDPTDPAVANYPYNSDPPTSGMHLEQFVPTLLNASPLPKYIQVHLLEHGNVLLQYNCTCPEISGGLSQIATTYNNQQLPAGQSEFTADDVQRIEEIGRGVFVAPYPGMKHKIALTAWTRLETLDSLDPSAVITFINAYLQNTENLTQ